MKPVLLVPVLVSFLAAAVAATPAAALGYSGHVDATGSIPTYFGSWDQQAQTGLTSALYSGTYGTYALGAGVHVLIPMSSPFYVSFMLGYDASMYRDYFLAQSYRYRWIGRLGGVLGVAYPIAGLGQLYGGLGAAFMLATQGAPLSSQFRWGPAGVAEAGFDFGLIRHLSVGPRFSLFYGPVFGSATGAEYLGGLAFSIVVGYGF